MTVFDRLHQGEHIDIRDADYQREVHGEIDRCDHLCCGKLIRLLSNGWWSLKTSSLTARSRMALT